MANAPQVAQLIMIKTTVNRGKSGESILMSLGSSEGLGKQEKTPQLLTQSHTRRSQDRTPPGFPA